MAKLALLVLISSALLLNTTFGEDNNVTNDIKNSDNHYEKRADNKVVTNNNDDVNPPFYTNRGRRDFNMLSQTPFLYPPVLPWTIPKNVGDPPNYKNPPYKNRGRLYYEYEQEPYWSGRDLRETSGDYTDRFVDNAAFPLWDSTETLEEDGPYWASRGRRELLSDENTVSVSYRFPSTDLGTRRQVPFYAEEPHYVLLRRDLDPSPSPMSSENDPFYVARGKRPEEMDNQFIKQFVNSIDQDPFYGARGKRSIDQYNNNANSIKDKKKDQGAEKQLKHARNKRESDSKNDLFYNLMVRLSENKKSQEKESTDDEKLSPVVILEKGRPIDIGTTKYKTVAKTKMLPADEENIMVSLSGKSNPNVQNSKIIQVKREADKRDFVDSLTNSEPFFESRDKKFGYLPKLSDKNKLLIKLLLNKYNRMTNVYDVKRTKASSSDQIFYNKMSRMHRNDADMKDPFFAHRGKRPSKVIESPFYAYRGRRDPDMNDNPFFAHRGKRQFDDNFNPFFAHRGKRNPDDNFNPFFANRGKRNPDDNFNPFFAHRGKRNPDDNFNPFFAHRGKRNPNGNSNPFFAHRGKRSIDENDNPFFAHRGKRTIDDSPFFAHRGKRLTDIDDPFLVQFGKRLPDTNDNPFFAHRGKRQNLDFNEINPLQVLLPDYEENGFIGDEDFEYK